MHKVLLIAGLLVGAVALTIAQPPPPVPQNLTVQQIPGAIGIVKLAWMAPEGPWAFQVYRASGENAFESVGLTQGHTFFDEHVSGGATYHYYVTSSTRLDSGIIESAPSDTVAITIQGGNTRVGAIVGTITDDSTNAPLAGIRVALYRSPNPVAEARFVYTNNLGHYETMLDSGSYLVKAGPGNSLPAYQPEWFDNVPTPDLATPVPVTPGGTSTADFALHRILFPQAPPRPTNLVASPVPGIGPAVLLHWDVPPGEWFYRVYRSVNDSDHFAFYGMTHDLSFVDRGVHPGNTYFYRVSSAIMTGGTLIESEQSNTAWFVLTEIAHVRGMIAGTVTDDSTGLPINHVSIRFFRLSGNIPPEHQPVVVTNENGEYEATLDTGTYLIRAEALANTPIARRYLPEWYDDAPTPETATPVAVAESSAVVADFGLSPLPVPTFATVSGTVRDTSGNPLRHASVAILRTIQDMNTIRAVTGQVPGLGEESMEIEGVGHTRGVMWRGFTDSLGNYAAHVISGQRYIAMASKEGYLPEYFDNKANPAEADVIALTGDTSGIDFSLAVRVVVHNSLAGAVRDSLGNGVPSRVVLLPVLRNSFVAPARFIHTDSNGVYLFREVRAGRYFALALPFSGYAPAFYKDGAYGVIDWHLADTVSVAGDVTGIDVGVVPIQSNGVIRVAGRIRNDQGGVLAGVHIVSTDGQGEVIGYGLTDGNGNYTIEAVTPGLVNFTVEKDGYTGTAGGVTIAAGTFTVNDMNYTLSSSPTSAGEGSAVPSTFALNQNYPNPFNPTTTIRYQIAFRSSVKITVFNLLGQEIATLVNGEIAEGQHEVVWNGRGSTGGVVPSGVYFYRMSVAPLEGGTQSTITKRMILLK